MENKEINGIPVKYPAKKKNQKLKSRLPEKDQFRMHELLSLLQQPLLLLDLATRHECLRSHLVLC